MPRQERIEVEFSKGQLLDAGAFEEIPMGFVRYLSGWQPRRGILVPRQPWIDPGITGGPVNAVRGRGIYMGFRTTGKLRPIVVAWDGPSKFGTGAHMKLYEVPTQGSDYPVDWAGAYSLIETITFDWAPEGSYYPYVFAAGKGHVVYSNAGALNGTLNLRLRKWDGSAVSDIAENNIAGRAIAYHQNRWWTGGDYYNPSRLRFSEEEDPDTWNVTTNFIKVRSRDGDPIETATSWENFLIVGKRDSVHFLYGGSPSNYGLREITDKVGTATGQHSVIPTPRGLCFVGSDGYVYRWNGGGAPERLTQHTIGVDEAFNMFEGTYESVPTYPGSLGFVDDILYAYYPGARYGVLCLDLGSGKEWVEEVTDGAPYEVIAHKNGLLMTPEEAAIGEMPLLSYRTPPYTAGNITLSGTPRPDPWGTNFELLTAAIRPTQLNGKASLKNLWILYSQYHDGTDGNGLTVTVTNEEGNAVSQTIGRKAQAVDQRKWYWDRVDTKLDGNAFTVRIHSRPADDTYSDTYTVERVVADFYADPEPR